ncbi:MAG: hypothetical protein IJU52_07490 [Clostridia bacterium]|nr:hypothetical protein [Clostridia bacterium]
MKVCKMILLLLTAALILTAVSCARTPSGETASSSLPDASSPSGQTAGTSSFAVPTSVPVPSSSDAPSQTPEEPTDVPVPTGTASVPSPSATSAEPTETLTQPGEKPVTAVYLGVDRYGEEGVDGAHKDDFLYRFFSEGTERRLALARTADAAGRPTYALQNLLEEGKIYDLYIGDGVVTALNPVSSASFIGVCEGENCTLTVGGRRPPIDGKTLYRIVSQPGGAAVECSSPRDGDALYLPENASCGYLTDAPAVYIPPVGGMPGVRTLTNFLRTALMPAGAVLYVYGGGWDWQDAGPARAACSTGLAQSWIDFFCQNDARYEYKNADASHSYYPFGAYNEYGYAGLDCSGFLSWALYNTLHEKSGEEGYISPSTAYAKRLSEQGLGTFSTALTPENYKDALRPGDIVSIKGHVYICLGLCPDGSAVILHSTVGDSREGLRGGGVQLSAIGTSEDCDAFRLADLYTAQFFPAWYARYPVRLCSPSLYCDVSADNAGFFRFDTSGAAFSDPDGVAGLGAEYVLALLFGEGS